MRKTISDRYEIVQKLDQGGMADVYLAHDIRFGRNVAVKVLGNTLHSASNRERFNHEAKTIANLEHRAIVPVYDFGYDEDELPYLVMRYMSGGSLRRYIRERDNLALDQVVRIANRLAVALDEAHDRNIIHRDIKPANILLNKENIPFLSDFGISRLVEKTTAKFTVIGTPAYMAPEQWIGEKLNRQTDVYQFGVTLFELLTGERPYQAYQQAEYEEKHLNAQIPSICAINPALPPTCDAVFRRALAKNAGDRYKEAGDLAKALANTIPARQINHRYEIQEVIKRGGMSAVYRAWDPRIQRQVAVKLMHESLADDRHFQQRFADEMKIIGNLVDDAIVQIHDVGEEKGRPYLVLGLMSGQSLRDMLDKERTLPPEKVLGIVQRLASALEAAHAKNIIHRDLKPDNVLFDGRGRAYLSDFGISVSLNDTRRTQAGQIVGTYDYMAPEQFTHPDKLGAATDVYQLGIMTFEMLTGERPFDSGMPNIMYQHINMPPPAATTFVDTLPYMVNMVLEKALAKAPKDRYQTPTAFYEALNKVLPQPIIASAPESPPLPAPEPELGGSFWQTGRGKAMVALSTLLLISAIIFALNRPVGDAKPPLAACLEDVTVTFDMNDINGDTETVAPSQEITITASQANIELRLEEVDGCPNLASLISDAHWTNPAVQQVSPTVVTFDASQFDNSNNIVDVALTFSQNDEVLHKDYYILLAFLGGNQDE